jgi:hypothetical protein
MKSWLIALALLATTTAAFAAPAPCASPLPEAAKPASFEAWLAADGVPDGVQKALTGLCLARFCSTNSQCACSQAQTATCSGSQCVYTYPGGGGGSTPHSGDACSPARFCTDSSQCASCKPGIVGVCATDGICRVP